MKENVRAVILAGGKGTRLWPLSSEASSKPFVKFGKRITLFEENLKIVASIFGRNILVVTDKKQARSLKKYKKFISKDNILIEPFGRNTASAIALAAITLDPEDVMITVPSDHITYGIQNYRNAIKDALGFLESRDEVILCVGTVPNRPLTSLGYIKISEKAGPNIYCVEKFIEKPDISKAKIYLREKRYLWNAGTFIFKAKTILAAIKRYAPRLYKEIKLVKEKRKSLVSAYKKMEDTSIDYQVMEKAENLYCVKSKFRWFDIGNWTSVAELSDKDKKGNIRIGKSVLIDVKDSVIYNLRKVPAGVIGLENVIVVNTDNGTLVCSKRDSESVKKLVSMFQRKA